MSLEEIRVYPNPFRDELEVEYIGQAGIPLEMRMLDMKGREILNEQRDYREDNRYRVELRGEELSMGVYLLEVRQGDRRKLVKVISKK